MHTEEGFLSTDGVTEGWISPRILTARSHARTQRADSHRADYQTSVCGAGLVLVVQLHRARATATAAASVEAADTRVAQEASTFVAGKKKKKEFKTFDYEHVDEVQGIRLLAQAITVQGVESDLHPATIVLQGIVMGISIALKDPVRAARLDAVIKSHLNPKATRTWDLLVREAVRTLEDMEAWTGGDAKDSSTAKERTH